MMNWHVWKEVNVNDSYLDVGFATKTCNMCFVSEWYWKEGKTITKWQM